MTLLSINYSLPPSLPRSFTNSLGQSNTHIVELKHIIALTKASATVWEEQLDPFTVKKDAKILNIVLYDADSNVLGMGRSCKNAAFVFKNSHFCIIFFVYTHVDCADQRIT